MTKKTRILERTAEALPENIGAREIINLQIILMDFEKTEKIVELLGKELKNDVPEMETKEIKKRIRGL